MGKETKETKRRSESRSKSARIFKVRKTKNMIARKNMNPGVIVYGKRKRIPTQRLLESLAMNKKTVNRPRKVKKVVFAKKIFKRMSTMQITAREGRKYLLDSEKMQRALRSRKY
mmetsp:Transcript_43371/g.50182  ORF Transcript_43371/g.50182 Transcript_43371/m.50182 type:complete len:114 (-) Transcript_43371:75-416(-)